MSRKEKFRQQKKASRNRKLKRFAAVAVLVLAGGFIGSHVYFQNHFKWTKINDVDVSGLTVAQATKKLNQSEIDQKGHYLVVKKSRIKLNSNDVKQLFKHRSSMSMLTSKQMSAQTEVSNHAYHYRMTVLLPKFKKRIDQLNITRKPTVDSTIKLANGQVTVKKGYQGNELDKASMVRDFKKQAKDNLIISVKMKKEVAASPDSSVIKNRKQALQKRLQNTVTLTTYNKSFTFKAGKWLTSGRVTANGKYHFDSTKLKNWVAKFANKVNTLGRSFTISKPKKVRISNGGTYGWKINQQALSTALLKNLAKKNPKNLNLKHYVSGTGYGIKGAGKTYVAVDLTNLEEYVYKNGQLKAKIPIMSGTLTGGNATPTGSYFIMYKQRHATLRGKNSDGSKYASPVGYWEPVTLSGVGLHDSPWQPASVYGNPSARSQYHSHGCLNNPPSQMPKVWKYTHTNEPVVIYK
ncbi:L,D-transpeptidase family protein [Lentilactobacillus raoultii]|uniref:L,D-transpeptidase family protein n=1 Tax=Lentilactobacillus raoultii TaxID=1987503 RepID=A0ABW3PQB8_9LACO|nr:L,D-transpeptidase [Lentilactobacillus raoultii]